LRVFDYLREDVTIPAPANNFLTNQKDRAFTTRAFSQCLDLLPTKNTVVTGALFRIFLGRVRDAGFGAKS
jgi:hypothetical protein